MPVTGEVIDTIKKSTMPALLSEFAISFYSLSSVFESAVEISYDI